MAESPVLNKAPEPTRPLSFVRAYWAGIRIALVGGVVLGLIETTWSWYRVGTQYGRGNEIPWDLFLGAGGRYVVTHALCWTALAVLYSLLAALWLVRRSRRGRSADPETVHLPVLLLLGGGLLIPFGLDLSRLLDTLSATLLILAMLVAATVAHVLLRALAGGWVFRALRGALRWSVIPALVVVGIGWVFMSRSPLRGADTYRVPPTNAELDISRDGPPNIVWIVLDTVRAERMSCYGYTRPTTLFLERFAAESVIYDRAVSSSYWTVPSHASLFTGLPVRAHGVDHESRWLDDDHVTIAELLSDAGYQTGMVANNPYICSSHNFGQGFAFAPPVILLERLRVMSWSHWCEFLGIGPIVPWMETDAGAAMTNREIAQWLDTKVNPQEPFFLYVNYMDAHMPYQAPKRVRRLFMSDEEIGTLYGLRRQQYGDILTKVLFEYNMLGPDRVAADHLRLLASLYDASIRYLDSRVEELISVFEQRGLLENTAIIIVSDHGEELGERDQWGHEFGVRDTLVHVPMMVRFPNAKTTGRVAYAVQTLDLFATTASLAGVETPMVRGMQSRDLTDVSPVYAAERLVVAECTDFDARMIMWAKHDDPNFQPARYLRELRAAFSGGYKLIWSSDGKHELYDVESDPDETDNLAEREPGLVSRIEDQLRNWVRSVPAYTYPSGKKKPHLDPHLERQLRALGYFR